MRASRNAKGEEQRAKGKKSKPKEIHVSGAEGLYEFSGIEKISRAYFLRAIGHPRGSPDRVVITMERVMKKPASARLLPFSTIECDSPDEAAGVIEDLLLRAGVSKNAIRGALRVVRGKSTTHGAALITSHAALRAEPDRRRGIRVSRLGIAKNSVRSLSAKLARKGINTTTVREAIVLASKVASCKGVMAELCVSDDPDYTTGYVASRRLGYVRITNIKKRGSLSGGRVFFVDEKADMERIIEYLEKTPVLVGTQPAG